jgi:hypothetical protein
LGSRRIKQKPARKENKKSGSNRHKKKGGADRRGTTDKASRPQARTPRAGQTTTPPGGQRDAKLLILFCCALRCENGLRGTHELKIAPEYYLSNLPMHETFSGCRTLCICGMLVLQAFR